ncbi:winged helix-turn-helix transcriptional regulator [Nitrosomonas oligotropha]|uniref:winged helix-turn-helix transcriptional regulator n=1 Tax=Nitrosomonas oligotropha TaxID=42354 RepID=UPI00136BF5A0|nr:helix-turn-helix domain-containing protein [Nitrosomonas oligotropha]MXS81673.1 transcriptional regulator [Nitrosomonas oligotropha]
MTKLNQIGRSSCPVSCALDIIGDKWTLLVVRDLIFFRKRYFGDFQNSPEKIATNILSDRLKRLEECHMILRRQDPANARKVIYMPTEKCLDLVPLIIELVSWGAKYVPESDAHEDLVQRFQQNRAEFMAEIHQSLREEME